VGIARLQAKILRQAGGKGARNDPAEQERIALGLDYVLAANRALIRIRDIMEHYLLGGMRRGLP
jgi:hypothetical protein